LGKKRRKKKSLGREARIESFLARVRDTTPGQAIGKEERKLGKEKKGLDLDDPKGGENPIG